MRRSKPDPKDQSPRAENAVLKRRLRNILDNSEDNGGGRVTWGDGEVERICCYGMESVEFWGSR